jgi:DNA-binding GntR family transcriptional regulator
LPFQTKIDIAYEFLLDRILSGAMPPGSRIDQDWVAGELGFSRMPVRQALIRLAGENLVTSEPHLGARVAELGLHDMTEVYATRSALETMLSGVATSRVTDDDWAHLSSLVEQQIRCARDQDIQGFLRLDWDFHHGLYSLADFPNTLEMVTQLRRRSHRYIARYLAEGNRILRSVEDHKAIVESVRAGEEKLVRELTQRHIEEGGEALRTVIENSSHDTRSY